MKRKFTEPPTTLQSQLSSICSIALSASALSCPTAQAATLYVADYYNNAIKTVDTITGAVTTFSTRADGLNGPIGFAFDSHGNLYASDYNSQSINKISADGKTVTPFVTGIDIPYGIAFDKDDNLFVTDAAVIVGNKALGVSLPNSGTIKKFTPDGKSSSVFTSGLSFPVWLAFDADGQLYESDHESDIINKIDMVTGVATPFVKTGLNGPMALVFDRNGNMFEAEEDGTKINKILPDGTVTTFADGLSGPFGLVLDDEGNFFASTNDNRISKILPDGTPIPLVTTGLNGPFGLILGPEPRFKNLAGSVVTETVPEPFTLVGTLIGGTAALRMRKKLKRFSEKKVPKN
jgi:sugar lactone lactonase YvrE